MLIKKVVWAYHKGGFYKWRGECATTAVEHVTNDVLEAADFSGNAVLKVPQGVSVNSGNFVERWVTKREVPVGAEVKQYKVVHITKNVEGYPQYAADTKEYPHLVKYVDDETDTFVVAADDPQDFYPASEFFFMLHVESFEAIVRNDE